MAGAGIVISCRVGEVPRKHDAAVGVAFALPHDRPEASAEQAELESPDP